MRPEEKCGCTTEPTGSYAKTQGSPRLTTWTCGRTLHGSVLGLSEATCEDEDVIGSSSGRTLLAVLSTVTLSTCVSL